ncbi:hypothetical protein Ddc_23247 [Ditylenchus destructor]|nr:hypothetical protein Ddc_23247 [Ditylenchus destructor]
MMDNQNIMQNQALVVIILDDTWLEALKHLTCLQWSKMRLVCHQVNGIVQQNISRLPRQVIDRITLDSRQLSFHPRYTNVAPSLQKLFHPVSYVRNVTMRTVNQELIDANFNGEERYIHCQTFELLPRTNESSTPQKIEKSLKWLEQNVRSDLISLPEWIFNRIHENVEIRAMLTNFIFDTSQKCKVHELVLSFNDYLFNANLVNVLIQDFFSFPVVQGTIPAVVIDQYSEEEEHRAHLGENLIGREVDSQGAVALYMLENGQKRIRISFCCENPHWYGYKAYLKFYTN